MTGPTPEGMIPLMSPVQRLETLLKRAIKSPKLPNPTGTAVAELFGLHPIEDRRNWSRAYLDLNSLVIEAKVYVRSIIDDFDGSPHSAVFEELERIIGAMDVNNTFSSYTQQFQHIATMALPFMVHATDGKESPPVVRADALAELRGDLDKLLDKIIKSDLDAPFKAELVRNLEAMRDSIVRVQVTGLDGIIHSAAEVVGAVVVYDPASAKKPGVVSEALSLVEKVQNVVLKSAKIAKIGAVAWKLLGPG